MPTIKPMTSDFVWERNEDEFFFLPPGAPFTLSNEEARSPNLTRLTVPEVLAALRTGDFRPT